MPTVLYRNFPLLYKQHLELNCKCEQSMNVKIDTKEKFTVITPEDTQLSANMTAELQNLLLAYLQKDIPHIILNLTRVQNTERLVIEALIAIQQTFVENNSSFVVCNIQESVKKWMAENILLEKFNHTPTESEAWDIIQMEEIERELLKEE